MLKSYICIKQHDEKDCGAACLATIAKQYGLKVPISKIREAAGTDKEGTSAFGVIKAAESIGLSAKGVKATKAEDIFTGFPTPAIAHVIIDKSLLHYVVIHKVSEKEIIVADPAKGIVKYKPSDFFEIWTGVLLLMVPSESFQKGDETKGLFQRFWGLIRVQKNILANVFVASMLITLLGIVGSFYSKFLLDSIIPNSLNSSLTVISLAMVILVVFRIITDFFRSLLMIHMSQNIDIPLLLGYYNHVISLPMNFFGTRKVGEIISRFNDASKIRDAISSATLTIMIDVIMAVVGGVILYMQSSKLFFTCFIPIVLYLALVVGFKKTIEKVNRDVMEDNAKLTSYLVESIEGIETVKAFNGERRVNLETEKKFIKLIKSVFKYGYVNVMQGSLKGTVKSIFGIAVLWIGAYLTISGEITIDDINILL